MNFCTGQKFFGDRSLRRALILLILRSTVDRRLSTAVQNVQVSDTTGDVCRAESW